MKRKTLKLILISTLVSLSPAQSKADEGSCDSNVQRDKKIILFKTGTLNDGEQQVKVKPTCEQQEKVIKKCAVISIQKKQLQKYCFPEDGKPDYAEIYDVIEYYEAKDQ